MSYSNDAKLDIKFNDFTTTTDFSDAVEKIEFMGRETRFEQALQLAKKEMFSSKNGARGAGVARILVIITANSQTYEEDDFKQEVDALKEAGVRIVVVGVGGLAKLDELQKMSTSGGGFVYQAKSFEEMISRRFIDAISLSACTGGRLHLHLCFFFSLQ